LILKSSNQAASWRRNETRIIRSIK